MAAARARSPGRGRNDRMCAAQKAWFAVTEEKNVNPSWRAAYWSPFSAFWVWSTAQVAGCPQAGPRAVATVWSRARVVAHVLLVGGPAAPGGGQLVPQRRDRRRVDAALAEDLMIRPGDDLAGEGHPDRAVDLGGQVRGLTGDLRDVVGRAAVADRVVVLQQRTHPRQRGGQVRIRGRGAEALRVPLVLQLDHPHVPDRPQAARCRGAGPGHRAGRAGPGTRAAGVLVHAARTSRNTAAASSHRRFFTISTPASNYVTVNHAGWRARPRPGSFPARRGPASGRCGAARCPGRASRSRRSG